MLGSSVQIGGGGAGGAVSITMNDDVLFKLGTDGDSVLMHKSGTNSADAEITSVIVGTSDISATAANSLFISNVTSNGDIICAGSDGGNSVQAWFFDSSEGVLHLGKPGTPGSATSTGDVFVAGALEVDGAIYADASLYFSPGSATYFEYYTSDTDARHLVLNIGDLTANYVPVLTMGKSSYAYGQGLFDGITQSLFVVLEKGNQLHTATDGIANDGGATAELNHVGGFTNAVVGDIVRITAGTSATAGWYWITTKTSNDVVVLDRNYASADTTNVSFVTFHNFPMIGADGVCLKCFDGAPTDSSTEIDRDGWLQLDVGNNQLYARTNATWMPLVSSMATDTGVGLVSTITNVAGADPYVMIGRDDTGVALNAVTDMLVLQGGGGSGNELAGQGVGISFKLGNSASEVEERASIDAVLQTNTNGGESSYLAFSVAAYPTMTDIMRIYTFGAFLSAGAYYCGTSVDVAASPDQVGIGGYEISAGHRALAIGCEEVVVVDVDETKFSHKLPVRINGATYNIMLTAT
jgi:hypothetical protein